uniref:GRB10-interacting GYF protein 2-like n=1 Tax=Myxine glutinosa TaxID=7769 RepID=UPI00358F27AD
MAQMSDRGLCRPELSNTNWKFYHQFLKSEMAAETQTLNFGPEWLRTLSSGGSVASPPPSPALPKYKLADHRYGREEMLALYIKDHKVPEELEDKEFLPILSEEPLLPLALVPFTEEEQRNFSMSVNSAAVLRLMGRGAGPPAAAARGRGTARGRDGRQPVEKDMLKRRDRGEPNSADQNLRTRGMSSGPSAEEIARPVRNFSTLSGRGRGESTFYQRSFDEVEVGFGRGAREINRSQSWEERAGERRYEKPGRREVGYLRKLWMDSDEIWWRVGYVTRAK